MLVLEVDREASEMSRTRQRLVEGESESRDKDEHAHLGMDVQKGHAKSHE